MIHLFQSIISKKVLKKNNRECISCINGMSFCPWITVDANFTYLSPIHLIHLSVRLINPYMFFLVCNQWKESPSCIKRG